MEQKITHKPRHYLLLACSALVFAALLCIPAAIRPADAAAVTDATVQKYEEELRRLGAEKAEIANQIYTAQLNKSSAMEMKTYLDQQINLTIEEINTLDALIVETDDKIGHKNLEIIDKKADVAEQRENFLTRLRITYEEGNTGYLELLLGAESLYDFLNRAERVGYMMDYNIKLMDKYKNDTIDLEAEEKALELLQDTNADAKVELDAKKVELERQQSDNDAHMQTLNNQISAGNSAYAKTVKEEEKVNAEMEEYIRELQAKANASYVGGEFGWPVDVKWKRITSQFGWRILQGVQDYHRGIDIGANGWENIYAANGGKVIKAEYHWSYGNYVIIDHGGGKSTLYAHAYQLLVKVGDTVEKGQTIAKVGNTGNSFGCHLHFEVRINGVVTNPLDGYVVQPK